MVAAQAEAETTCEVEAIQPRDDDESNTRGLLVPAAAAAAVPSASSLN
eukprot:SAG31_NODE_7875_length_1576_cov_1.593771_3_plen_47_part_01